MFLPWGGFKHREERESGLEAPLAKHHLNISHGKQHRVCLAKPDYLMLTSHVMLIEDIQGWMDY